MGEPSSAAPPRPAPDSSREPEPLVPLFALDDPPERKGCDKVDFLYVVDNSPSMLGKQASLARSFLGFSRVVERSLGAMDHQIMVIDTDDTNVGDILNGMHADAGDPCAGRLGAGLRRGADGQSCGVLGGQHFLRGDQPNLAAAFSCLAQVGTFGDSSERPVDALLAATGARPSAAGTCNTGFLREDAVLVVTLITDEEDDQSNGEPRGWKRTLLATKAGDERSIVVLGLIPDLHVPGGLPGGPCDEAAGARAPRLQEFVASFELGALGSVCASDYSEFFAAAVEPIHTACSELQPSVR